VAFFTGVTVLDPILSIAIALIIAAGAVGLVRKAVHVLLEAVPEHIDLVEVFGAMKAVAGVTEVHDLHVWTISHSLHALSAHLVCSARCRTATRCSPPPAPCCASASASTRDAADRERGVRQPGAHPLTLEHRPMATPSLLAQVSRLRPSSVCSRLAGTQLCLLNPRDLHRALPGRPLLVCECVAAPIALASSAPPARRRRWWA
jgi:hypothetical protein